MSRDPLWLCAVITLFVRPGALHHVVKRCYDAPMRTTVDLPPFLHMEVKELAKEEGTSISAIVARLTRDGMNQLDRPSRVRIDSLSGFPTVRTGRRRTVEEVADLIEEDP